MEEIEIQAIKKGGVNMVEKYNYRMEIKKDIYNFIDDNEYMLDLPEDTQGVDFEEFYNDLYDKMWIADDVTGNGSGSYFFNRYEAEEALFGNLDLLAEACEEFCCDVDVLKSGAENCDVTIRCYLLSEVLADVLKEIKEGLLVF